MIKKLLTAAIVITGILFIFAAASDQPSICENNDTHECWQYDIEKGWIYNAPMINVVPTGIQNEDWSYDEEFGWIYNAPQVDVTSEPGNDNWTYDEESGWIFHAEEINIIG